MLKWMPARPLPAGSIGAPQPTSSGGSTGTAPPPRPLTPGAAQAAAAAAAAATPLAPMLVSKVLTYSDVSTEVARTGRIVLPRIQVRLAPCQREAPGPRNRRLTQ